jgi:two-component system, NarL family, response regulator
MMDTMDPVRASVLIIEKHPLMRAALCSAIAEEADLQVAEADVNHSQLLMIPGLEDVILLPESSDMILLSLGNPGFKELDALKALRHSYPNIPILALTSSEVPGQEQAALATGAQAAVAKTTSRGELIQALREMWGKNSIHHQKSTQQEVNENTSNPVIQYSSSKHI